jgi:hypothetical protein
MTQRYERLRAMRRMGAPSSGEMELMMGSGICSWMDAWGAYASDSPLPVSTVAHSRNEVEPSSNAALPRQAVGILSAMVWTMVKEKMYAIAR